MNKPKFTDLLDDYLNARAEYLIKKERHDHSDNAFSRYDAMYEAREQMEESATRLNDAFNRNENTDD